MRRADAGTVAQARSGGDVRAGEHRAGGDRRLADQARAGTAAAPSCPVDLCDSIASDAGHRELAHEDSKFTEQQIAFILKQADDGVSVEDTCRKAGLSIQTYYRCRQKYGGRMPSEMLA